ncbi:MAG: LysE family transporter [Rhodospirillales bacterium]|nr:LysE family transporter [Rhodospirillales bacterium]
MLIAAFLKGLIAGFLIAAPVGPINVLCVRRTLLHGRVAGFISGLGAAVADTLYGAIAAFGLAFAMSLLLEERLWLSLGGAALLFAAGLRTLFSHPPRPSDTPDPTSLIGDFTSTFFLTLTNPITILSFLAVFAAFGIEGYQGITADGWWLILGVFTGSAAWWLTLTGLVGMFHGKFSEAGLEWANRAAGLIILAFAVVVLWEGLKLAF